MWPWEKIVVSSRAGDHSLIMRWISGAENEAPLSMQTSPSPVSKALTFANELTNAVPGEISTSSPRGANGSRSTLQLAAPELVRQLEDVHLPTPPRRRKPARSSSGTWRSGSGESSSTTPRWRLPSRAVVT